MQNLKLNNGTKAVALSQHFGCWL